MEGDPGPSGKPGEERNQRWLLRCAVVAVALVAGLVSWLATRDGGSESAVETGDRIVSEAGLAEESEILGQPIFWAGALPGTEVELHELSEGGGVQIVYLPEGTDAEEASSGALTIGSYPVADPAAALDTVAREPGGVVRRAADGRKLVTNEERPGSVYFASPGNEVQVEVYDPSAKRAMGLAGSGRVVPVS